MIKKKKMLIMEALGNDIMHLCSTCIFNWTLFFFLFGLFLSFFGVKGALVKCLAGALEIGWKTVSGRHC